MVPVNTTAEIHLPAKAADIFQGKTPVSRSGIVQVMEKGDNSTTLLVGSGNYTFTINKIND